jgi:hypothetical protein
LCRCNVRREIVRDLLTPVDHARTIRDPDVECPENFVMSQNTRMNDRRDFAPTDDRLAASLRERLSLACSSLVGIAASCSEVTDAM